MYLVIYRIQINAINPTKVGGWIFFLEIQAVKVIKLINKNRGSDTCVNTEWHSIIGRSCW